MEQTRGINKKFLKISIFLLLVGLFCKDVRADEGTIDVAQLKQGLDTVWVLMVLVWSRPALLERKIPVIY